MSGNEVLITVKGKDDSKAAAASAQKNIKGVATATDGAKKSLGLFKVAAGALAGSGLIKFLVDSVSEARESQLVKALNDPIHGVTSLMRVGVTFTAQQKEQIKTLVDTGHTMDAQKVILAELTKEFGGSAAAQATASDKAKVAWKNVEEQVGTA